MPNHLKSRIQRIQRHLGLTADGIIGVATLTAIENRLFGRANRFVLEPGDSLIVSRKGLALLVKHEISSAAYYRKHLSSPVYPGGQSGVTIGIGYDLGYNTPTQIRGDWEGAIGDQVLERLLVVSGLKGAAAKAVVDNLSGESIPLDAAEQVFYQSTLPRYAKATARAYSGIERLFPDAQAALLSLVYNRGTRMSGGSRREMKAIKAWVEVQDYSAIADEIKSMKRLWQGKGLPGLLKRRESEARLVLAADRLYEDEELVRL